MDGWMSICPSEHDLSRKYPRPFPHFTSINPESTNIYPQPNFRCKLRKIIIEMDI